MLMRETLAAADLIPGDLILARGWEVVGYPHGGPFGKSWLPVAQGTIEMQVLVGSETPYDVIR